MSWKDRHNEMSSARDDIHESFKIPVLISNDNASSWGAGFCRLHEASNFDGNKVNNLYPGNSSSKIVVDSDNPQAIFKVSESSGITNKSVISVRENVSYIVKQISPPDSYGYRYASLTRNNSVISSPYPYPDWEDF